MVPTPQKPNSHKLTGYKKHYIVCLCIVAALFSCKKKRDNVPVNAGMKNAYSFMAGTYWVFRDSVSGREDSFVIRDVVNTNYAVSDNTYDKISYLITQYNTTNLNDTISWTWELVDNTMLFHWINGAVHYDYAPVTYPFADGYFNAISNTHADTLRKFNSYKLRDTTYYSGVKINFLDYGVNDWIILNADVGLIELILSRVNRVWELERWEVVR